MKLYGYEDQGLTADQVEPKALAEITLVATPDELRKMAAFLNYTATEMDRLGEQYSHLHLSDYDQMFQASPHLTVFSDTVNSR